jgi:hypothetical protein
LTRQPVQGRTNDGGLRVGEMERDAICAHGLAYFLNESFLIRGDEYYMAVCNKTGAIAIYNEEKNLFLSPYADGPINFTTNPDGSMNISNLSRFGRSFSLLRIPYSFKLLIQELQVMNINMIIITDENVDQLLNMSYSNNIAKLLQVSEERTPENYEKLIRNYIKHMTLLSQAKPNNYKFDETPQIPTPVGQEEFENTELQTLQPGTQTLQPPSPASQEYVPGSLAYLPISPDSHSSPPYAEVSPAYVPPSPTGIQGTQRTPLSPDMNNSVSSILEVQPEKQEEEKLAEEKQEEEKQENSDSSSEVKKVIEINPQLSSEVSTSSGTKKITL